MHKNVCTYVCLCIMYVCRAVATGAANTAMAVPLFDQVPYKFERVIFVYNGTCHNMFKYISNEASYFCKSTTAKVKHPIFCTYSLDASFNMSARDMAQSFKICQISPFSQ